MDYLRLHEGDTVAVLGGGPAGSFFALHMKGLSRKHGIGLNVVIIERKSFATHGPVGCNMCAGVLGGNIVNMISGLDILLDSRVIRQNVQGFRINMHGMGALIERPGAKVYTVFRGIGPRPESSSEGFIGFDSFLLEEAKKAGAAVINGTVTDVVLPGDPEVEQCIVRYSDDGHGPGELRAALIAGAFGVNSALSGKFGFGYTGPGYWHTCQTELMADTESDITRYISIFSRRHSKFLFTAITPKGRYVTVSGIGRHVRFSELIDELKALRLDQVIETGLTPVCHCHPRLPVTAAVRPFSTRVVMIGDACVSRYMKNGIESAFITSRYAAETALLRGIDEAAFRDAYYPGCVANFVRDNRFGRAMFFLHRTSASSRRMGSAIISTINDEGRMPVHRQWMSNITWHMFVGDKPYRLILRDLLGVLELLKLLVRIIGTRKRQRSDRA
ncbi:MAG: hypothetical protein M1491_09945 [Deltaproteobacteria bacterium]|nr:hypothetical protein [Deltaproteobacteria bacterium]MCL5277088.1 hypothetical protein [Deltaproteobacteria bacterium]